MEGLSFAKIEQVLESKVIWVSLAWDFLSLLGKIEATLAVQDPRIPKEIEFLMFHGTIYVNFAIMLLQSSNFSAFKITFPVRSSGQFMTALSFTESFV